MNILIAGDFCPYGHTEVLFKAKEYSKVLFDIKDEFKNADFSLVNLEAPVLRRGSHARPIAKCGPALQSDGSSIEALKYLGVSCVSLANNHFRDYGDEGCQETIEAINASGILHVGGGMNASEASSVLTVTIDNKRIAFINCCEHEFSIATATTAGSNPLDPITQFYQIKEAKKDCDYVVIIVHGGLELFQYPSLRMKQIYRFFVNAGADAVINHHQHCYSGYEVYRGKPIFYGLGNFCFDWQGRPSCWYEGIMVQLSLGDTISFEVIPFSQGKDGKHIVKRMSDEELDTFNLRFAELNANIMNDEFIENEHVAFLRKNSLKYRLSLEPYNSRIAKKLYRLGFLPSFLSKRKSIQLLNFIECESHLPGIIDSLRY